MHTLCLYLANSQTICRSMVNMVLFNVELISNQSNGWFTSPLTRVEYLILNLANGQRIIITLGAADKTVYVQPPQMVGWMVNGMAKRSIIKTRSDECIAVASARRLLWLNKCTQHNRVSVVCRERKEGGLLIYHYSDRTRLLTSSIMRWMSYSLAAGKYAANRVI